MFNKIYVKIKRFISKSYMFFLGFGLSMFVMLFEFPYYIEAPGGVINVANRISMESANETSGSFNMAYVSEYKATLPMLIIALLNDNWDIQKKSDVLAINQTNQDLVYQNKLLLQESNQNAILYAYNKANKKVNITSSKIYVTYVFENALTNLKIGDEIIAVNDVKVSNKYELVSEIDKYSVGETVKLLVKENNKEVVKSAIVQSSNERKIIGFMVSVIQEFDVEPKINVKYISSESGPSGGLLTCLTIYNYLTDEDITGGLKIAGTGTIDEDGNVGSIGGVKYKILGAVKDKVKYFLIPAGDNYEEAKTIIKENNYDITLIPVTTFDEALEKLNNLKNY